MHNAKFCTKCGNVLLVENQKFCNQCGTSLDYKKNNKTKINWGTLIVVGIGILFLSLIVYDGSDNGLSATFPSNKSNPKTTALNCNYAGSDITMDVTTYENINEYYEDRRDFNTEYYEADSEYIEFIYENEEDNTIDSLAEDITQTANANGLAGDQVLELAVCFVQNIPYDYEKYNTMNGNTPNTEQYPYETLYNNSGICTDTTYLTTLLLNELGYETAVFSFEDHFAAGVKVPDGYGSFESSYAMLETTVPGYAPGMVPDNIDPNNGSPTTSLNAYNQITTDDNPESLSTTGGLSTLSPVGIIKNNDGTEYSRIVSAVRLEKEILALGDVLDSKNLEMIDAKNNVSYWENRQLQAYDNYINIPATTYQCYAYYGCDYYTNPSATSAYNTYSSYYGSYENAIDVYSEMVANYNEGIENYNTKLINYQNYQYN